jgi:hypothetical protein
MHAQEQERNTGSDHFRNLGVHERIILKSYCIDCD